MISRLRWFFLSILIVYFWLNPSFDASLLFAGSFQWHELFTALLPGLERIFSLILIVFAVAYLLSGLRQDQLLGAIYWLATPLILVGLDRERLALRLVLSLERVKQITQYQRAETADKINQEFINSWVKKIVWHYHRVIEIAEAEACQRYTFERLSMPSYYEWLYPLLLYVAFILAGQFNLA